MHTVDADSRKVLSFFTGAMGLDIGLAQAGLEVRVGQELDRDSSNSIRANGHAVVEGDLRVLLTTDPKLESLLEIAGAKRGNAFAAVGGPPCQPFSTAGRRLGIEDERGRLIFDYLQAVEALMPRFVVLENVKGILGAAGEGEDSLLDQVRERMAAAGYSTVAGVVDAVNYGAPQFRERMIIVGSRDSEPVFLPAPTHHAVHQDAAYRWKTLRSAIADLEENPGPSVSFSPRLMDVIKSVPEGGNWRSLPPEVAKEAMGGAWESGGGKVGFFRRLSYAQPSPTLVTSPTQKATMLAHPTQDRPLSVREYARIQGFPDDWSFSGSVASQYKQIGNAVPIPLGRAIGQMLAAVADGTSQVHTKRRRGTSVHEPVQAGESLSDVA
jgi:DNA (cytosine-5)-methyltransferase 1